MLICKINCRLLDSYWHPTVLEDNGISAKVYSVVELWLSSPILNRKALLQLLQMNSVLGSVDALSSHPTAIFSSPNTPAFAASLQWFRFADIASQCVGLILPAFGSRLQNNFEAKARHSYRSSSSGKLDVQYVLMNSSVLHAAYMAKPAYSSLIEQGEHAR